MQTLANISQFESLQANANAAMGVQSAMGVFNAHVLNAAVPFDGIEFPTDSREFYKLWDQYKQEMNAVNRQIGDWGNKEAVQKYGARRKELFDILDAFASQEDKMASAAMSSEIGRQLGWTMTPHF